MTVPLLLGPAIGGVASDRARLWLRASRPSTWKARVSEVAGRVVWESEPVRTQEEAGHLVLFSVLGLRPERAYRYSVVFVDATGQEVEVARGGFRTAPRLTERRDFTFCMLGTLLPQAHHAADMLHRVREQARKEDAAFFLTPGPLLAADAVPDNGLERPPVTLEEYHRLYQAAWSQPSWGLALQEHPIFAMWSHREVDWGWAWADVDRTQARLPFWLRWWRRWQGFPPASREVSRQRVVAALQAYWQHLGVLTVDPPAPPEGADVHRPLILPADRGHLGYAFAYGAAAFLVLDLHTHRIRSGLVRRLLHPEQWRVLEGWLATARDAYPLTFVVTSAAVFSRGPGDYWGRFPDALRRLLHMVAARGLRNLIFLSHGLEWGRVVEAQVQVDGHTARLWEIGVGGVCPGRWPRVAWRPVGRAVSPLLQGHRVLASVSGPQFACLRVSWQPAPRVSWTFFGLQGQPLAEGSLNLENVYDRIALVGTG